MAQEKSIESKGMVCIILNLMIANLFIGQVRLFSSWVGNASWILFMLGFCLQFMIFILTARLYRNCYQKDPLDLAKETFGLLGEIVVALAFFIYFLLSFASLSRLYCEAIKTVLFQNSPIWYIALFFILCAGFGAHAGILSIARVSTICLPFIILLVFVVCLFNIPNVEMSNIYPILGTGRGDIFSHLPQATGPLSEITTLYLFLPFSKKKGFPKKAGYIVLFTSGFVLLSTTLLYALTVVYPASAQYFLSMYQLSRISYIGVQIGRWEDATEFFWTISVILALSTKLWMAAYIFKKILRLPETKPIVWPLVVLGFAIGFFPSARNLAIEAYEDYFVNNIGWMVSLIPLFIVICYQIKRKVRGETLCSNMSEK